MRGLMSPGFNGFENRRSYWAYLFARLKPGVSIEQAHGRDQRPLSRHHQRRRGAAAEGHERADDGPLQGQADHVEAGRIAARAAFDDEARAPLTILLVVTGTVLLIACANIANLLLVRGAGRSAEMAVRLSIGANRRQLITQLLTESIVLAAFGGVAGLFVAKWTLDLIASLMPAEDARHRSRSR